MLCLHRQRFCVMTPADCNRMLPDADPPMPWSYRYSTPEECLAVKQEPEWEDCGEGEAASWATLYADHDVKDEIVFGPEQFQPQDIAISMQHALIKSEEDPSVLKLADEASTEDICSPILSEEPQTDKTLQQLTYCFVRLERFILGEHCTASSSFKDKPFKCNICQKQFIGQGYLTNHIKSHIDYSCHICLVKCFNPRFLTAHMELHKTKQSHCNVCNTFFTKSSEFIEHMLDHTSPYSCNICPKRFKCSQYLASHKYKCHPDHTKPKEHCEICPKQFAYKRGLIIHTMHHHRNNKRYKYILNKLRQQPSSLESHTKQKTYSINIYKKKFVTKQRLLTRNLRLHGEGKHDKQTFNKHEDGHTKEEPHCCAVCQTKFVNRKTLLTHMQMRHPKANKQLAHTQNHGKEKPHCCTICQRRFVYRKTLLTHMQMRHPKAKEQLAHTHDHKKEKPHCCPICQRRFVYRKTLLTHMRVRHPKANEQPGNKQDHEKPHCCTICQKRFVYRKTLLTHMRMRHPKANKQLGNKQDHEKPHCCTICQRRFVYRKTLLTHMQMRHPRAKEQLAHTHDHEKEKPHCCTICQRRFVYRKTLLTHMRERHPKANEQLAQTQENEKPHCCTICQRRFVYRKTLLTHMRMRHPKANEQLGHTQDHEKEKPHCCTICQRRFVYRKTLLTHMRVRHPKANEQIAQTQEKEKEKPHCCTICQRRFVYRKTLLTHMGERHPKANEQLAQTQENKKEKPHCCTICQRRFVYRQTLLTHMRRRHQKPKERHKQLTHEPDLSKGKPHCCSVCQKRFVYRKTLITHMQKHPGSKPDTQVTQPTSLAKQRHCQKTQQKVNEPNKQLTHSQDLTEAKPHCCEICQKRFVYRKTLKTHMRKHRGRKPDAHITQPPSLAKQKKDLGHDKAHCCKICQRRFVHRKTLLTHMRIRHEKVNEPNKELTQNHDKLHQKENEPSNQQITPPSNSTKHEQDHAKERLHCCDICQKRFVYTKTLLTHMRRRHQKPKKRDSELAHEPDVLKEKRHCCDVCQKRFMYRKFLHTHMRIHHQKVNGLNNQQITPPSNFTKHEQNHAKEKPHCCEICQRRFVYRKTLKTHMRKHRGRKPDAQVTQPSNLATQKQDLGLEKAHCCQICQRRFMYRRTLLTHMGLRHQNVNEPTKQLANNQDLTEVKSHCCEICQRRFVYKKTLLTHMRLRHKKVNEPNKQLANNQNLTEVKPHCCEICQRRFVYRKTLKTHMRKHRGRKPNTQVTQPSNLATKKQDLELEKAHCCKNCQRRFMYRKTLLTHMRLRHQKVNEPKLAQNQDLTEEKTHCCKVCQRRFVYRKTLLTHMRKHPENKSNLQLNQPSGFAKEQARRVLQTKQGLTLEKAHCCDICQRRFVYQKTLLTHMRLRHEKVKVPEHQQITLKLSASEQDHTKDKPHCCSVCRKRFVYKKTLLTHMRLRHEKVKGPEHQQITPILSASEQDCTKEKPHCCSVCRKRFVYKKTLLTHMRLRHEKVKVPENQQITPKSSASEQDHTKEKPHCCSVCRKRFVYKKTLLTHMRLRHEKVKGPEHQQITPKLSASEQDHTKEKLHCCSVCRKQFVYKKTLLTHMRLRHQKASKLNKKLTGKQGLSEEKRHCCNICQKRFVYEKVLLTHMQQHTEGKPNGSLVSQSKADFILNNNNPTHTQQKLAIYTCDICEKQFAHKITLDNHLRLHSALKPRFTELNSPTIHTTGKASLDASKHSHTVEKPYSCNLCREHFENLDVLIGHAQQWHTDEKIFRCNIQSITK